MARRGKKSKNGEQTVKRFVKKALEKDKSLAIDLIERGKVVRLEITPPSTASKSSRKGRRGRKKKS